MKSDPHLTWLLVFNVVLLAAMCVPALWYVSKAKKSKNIQDGLLVAMRKKHPGFVWTRIYVARPAYYLKKKALAPFETRGILGVGLDTVKIAAIFPDGVRLDSTIARASLGLQWFGKRTLFASNVTWFSIGVGAHQVMVGADVGINSPLAREATADLFATLAPDRSVPKDAEHGFALESNLASKTMVGVFVGLASYAVIDGFFLNPYRIVGAGVDLQVIAIALAIISAMQIPTYEVLRKNSVPWRESLGLCALVVAAAGCAFLPATKRLDAALSEEGVKTYEYVHAGGARLEPVKPGPPSLSMDEAPEYWEKQAKGSVQQVELVHGRFGLWQVEIDSWHAKYRAFYRAQRGES